jgi:hypothetical protein
MSKLSRFVLDSAFDRFWAWALSAEISREGEYVGTRMFSGVMQHAPITTSWSTHVRLILPSCGLPSLDFESIGRAAPDASSPSTE